MNGGDCYSCVVHAGGLQFVLELCGPVAACLAYSAHGLLPPEQGLGRRWHKAMHGILMGHSTALQLQFY